MESALSKKGRATIPKEVRDHLPLQPGDKIKFFIHPNGGAVILPKIPTSQLRGMLQSSKRRIAIDKIENVAAQASVQRFRRSAN